MIKNKGSSTYVIEGNKIMKVETNLEEVKLNEQEYKNKLTESD